MSMSTLNFSTEVFWNKRIPQWGYFDLFLAKQLGIPQGKSPTKPKTTRECFYPENSWKCRIYPGLLYSLVYRLVYWKLYIFSTYKSKLSIMNNLVAILLIKNGCLGEYGQSIFGNLTPVKCQNTCWKRSGYKRSSRKFENKWVTM